MTESVVASEHQFQIFARQRIRLARSGRSSIDGQHNSPIALLDDTNLSIALFLKDV